MAASTLRVGDHKDLVHPISEADLVQFWFLKKDMHYFTFKFASREDIGEDGVGLEGEKDQGLNLRTDGRQESSR